MYIFKAKDNSCSVIHNRFGISDDVLSTAIMVVDELPPYNTPDGYIKQLMYSPIKKALYWNYVYNDEEVIEEVETII